MVRWWSVWTLVPVDGDLARAAGTLGWCRMEGETRLDGRNEHCKFSNGWYSVSVRVGISQVYFCFVVVCGES